MSLFKPNNAESRSLTYQDVWGSGGSWGTTFTADNARSALRLAPVYSATSLIANLISTSPREVFRERQPGKLESMPTQPALIHNPSPFQGTWIDWLHQGLSSVLLTGNAYGYIVAVDSQGSPSKIVWFNPYEVAVIEEQSDWFHTPTYYWRGRRLDPTLVVHVPGYLLPGSCIGLSPIALFQRQIETGMYAQNFQLDWFKNGAAPTGHFKNTAQTLGDGVAEKIKDRFKAAVSSRDILVTGNDWEWTALAVPADQAQFLQAIEANATTIASIYHLDAESVGGSTGGASGGKSSTYRTLEQDGLKMNTRALAPWARRFEEKLSVRLPGAQTLKINLRHLAKGTVIEDAQANAVRLTSGEMTQDEVRAAAGRDPMTPEEQQFWTDHYTGKGAPKPNLADPASSKGE